MTTPQPERSNQLVHIAARVCRVPGLDPAVMQGISLELATGLMWTQGEARDGGRNPQPNASLPKLPALVSICVQCLRHHFGPSHACL